VGLPDMSFTVMKYTKSIVEVKEFILYCSPS
jgi:hypothetical protein